MYFLLAMATMIVIGTIMMGIYLELRPANAPQHGNWMRGSLAANIVLFVLADIALLILGVQDVMAQQQMAAQTQEISVGMGLAILGVGLPTAAAAIGAGIAVGPVASAALAVTAEKPETFGRSLVYLGLAEGIAIYGLVVSILLLGKI